MTTSNTTERSSIALCSKDSGELSHAALALFDELGGSLETSTKAVLQRDPAALQQATAHQRLLLLELKALVSALYLANRAALPEQLPSNLANELSEAAQQVLQSARLQAALLRRAHRFASALSNLLAGAQREYAGPEFASSIGSRIFPHSAPGGGSCRP